jgi:transcriptional regulator CtsR
MSIVGTLQKILHVQAISVGCVQRLLQGVLSMKYSIERIQASGALSSNQGLGPYLEIYRNRNTDAINTPVSLLNKVQSELCLEKICGIIKILDQTSISEEQQDIIDAQKYE